ncbi:MAG: OmpA family protein, partial [Saprospiraceae bacterium]|nr:OmpA family protein [Saprospiraceae bacterium]
MPGASFAKGISPFVIKITAMFSGRKLVQISFVFCFPVFLAAQKEAPILLSNPSFEDIPHRGEVGGSGPAGWFDCPSKSGESAPDIQPGFWEVKKPASHGSSYLGLVVREKESWEGVGQRLSRPLEKNQCYEFSLDLCKSDTYLSPTSQTGPNAPFTTPAKIIIWGGNGYCDKAEVLAQSTIVTHTRWITYNFRLEPKKGNYSFLMIEAYYKTPVLFPYNGHVLVDNATPIKPIMCAPEKMPESKKVSPPVTAKQPDKQNPAAQKVNPNSNVAVAPKKDEPKTEAPIGKNTKKNVVYRLEKVYFDANKFELKPESETQLYELLEFLKKRPDVAIEVGGHTNNAMWPNDAFATELSTKRAKAVAD